MTLIRISLARPCRFHHCRFPQPAVIGGLPVRPGDLVVADDDGVVVVPSELTDETVRRALAKASKEDRLRDALEAGSTLRAAYDRFGVL